MRIHRNFLACIALIGMLSLSQIVFGQALELQGDCTVNCVASELCMTLNLRTTDANTAQLGTSSLMFTYNPAALSFLSYTSNHFDKGDLCNGGVASFTGQTHDTIPGVFDLTMILLPEFAANSCPTIDDQAWVEVGTVCFDIVNSNVFPAITIDTNHTRFNTNVPDDGTIEVPLDFSAVYHATCATDQDSDGIADAHDNCVGDSNPLQEDSDNDGIGDVCDPQCNFVLITPPDITVCSGETVTLTALGQGGVPPYTYDWSTGDTSSTIQVAVTSIQLYQVTMTDANTCIGTGGIEVDVSVGGLSSVVIYDIDNDSIFDVLDDGDVFLWSSLPYNFNIESIAFGDVSSIGYILEGAQYDTDRENSPPYRYPGDFEDFEPLTGSYTFTATTFTQNNMLGVSCDQQVFNFSIVNDCAILNLPEVVPLCLGETVTIHSNVQNTHGAYEVQWSNGMTGDSITITPTETFFLVATVVDESNCSTQASTEVHVTSADIVTLLIINSGTGAIWDTIKGGEIYHVDSFPNNYYLRADVIAGNTESVGFDLTADFGVWGHTDNSAPYRFPSGNIDFWQDNFTMTVAAWDGNWRQGYSCGSYSFSFQVVDYDPACNLVTNTSDSGVGSLPYALGCAQWWQTVYFDPAVHHDTIILQSNYGLFSTGAKLSALAQHEVYIKAEGTPYALYIEPDVETRIDGVRIISGTAAQGAGIYNAGTVTLENVTVKPHPGMSTVDPVFNLGNMYVRGFLDVQNE